MKGYGFHRMGAFLIDMFLIGIAYTLVLNLIPEEHLTQDLVWNGRSFGWSFDLYGILTAAYFVGSDLLNRGASPGKDILRLQTVRVDGTPLSYPQSLARSLLKLISIWMLPVAAFLYVWKGKAFTLQDYLLQTEVRPVQPLKST